MTKKIIKISEVRENNFQLSPRGNFNKQDQMSTRKKYKIKKENIKTHFSGLDRVLFENDIYNVIRNNVDFKHFYTSRYKNIYSVPLPILNEKNINILVKLNKDLLKKTILEMDYNLAKKMKDEIIIYMAYNSQRINVKNIYITKKIMDTIIRYKDLIFLREELLEDIFLEIIAENKKIDKFVYSLPLGLNKGLIFAFEKENTLERFHYLCIFFEGYFSYLFSKKISIKEQNKLIKKMLSKKIEQKATFGNWATPLVKDCFNDNCISQFIDKIHNDIRNEIKGHGCFYNNNSSNYDQLETSFMNIIEKLIMENLEIKNKQINSIEIIGVCENKKIKLKKDGFLIYYDDLMLTLKGISIFKEEIEYYNFSNPNFNKKIIISYKENLNNIFNNEILSLIEEKSKILIKSKCESLKKEIYNDILGNSKKNNDKSKEMPKSINFYKTTDENEVPLKIKISVIYIEKELFEIGVEYAKKGLKRKFENNEIIFNGILELIEENDLFYLRSYKTINISKYKKDLKNDILIDIDIINNFFKNEGK
jgi:hypothetical protein